MKLTRQEISICIDEIRRLYPDAECELDFTSPFELLVATILSAQCTDIRVNIVTKELFERCKSPQDIIDLGSNELLKIIKTCGLAKSKSQYIYNSAIILVEEYDEVIPNTLEALTKLPGVGRKTANVVLSNAYGVPAIAVDTHVFRVSNRLGLANAEDVFKTEKQLMKVLPEEIWVVMHHALILHGRRVCKARKPLCESCTLTNVCKYFRMKEVKDGK